MEVKLVFLGNLIVKCEKGIGIIKELRVNW